MWKLQWRLLLILIGNVLYTTICRLLRISVITSVETSVVVVETFVDTLLRGPCEI